MSEKWFLDVHLQNSPLRWVSRSFGQQNFELALACNHFLKGFLWAPLVGFPSDHLSVLTPFFRPVDLQLWQPPLCPRQQVDNVLHLMILMLIIDWWWRWWWWWWWWYRLQPSCIRWLCSSWRSLPRPSQLSWVCISTGLLSWVDWDLLPS